jgi:hypothetical protein
MDIDEVRQKIVNELNRWGLMPISSNAKAGEIIEEILEEAKKEKLTFAEERTSYFS